MEDADSRFVANAATAKVIGHRGKILFSEVRVVSSPRRGAERHIGGRRGYFTPVSAEPMPPLVGQTLRISRAVGSSISVEITSVEGGMVHFRRHRV